MDSNTKPSRLLNFILSNKNVNGKTAKETANIQ
jgi:hypothetical protein